MTITVFVGDSDHSIARRAKQYDPSAYLVDCKNFEQFLSMTGNAATVYTAQSDLPKITDDRAVLYEILNKADVIYYSPPEKWSDLDSNMPFLTTQKTLTQFFLLLINNKKNNVIGLDLSEYNLNKYLALKAVRNSNSPSLWSAGCSIAEGVGVEPTERYANIISEKINMPLNDLATIGSSIEYAADQILRSNITANDLVIWGLTEETRFPVWNSELDRIKPGNNRLIQNLTETRIYKSITSVHQVKNFCNKINARLIMVPILCSENFRLMLNPLPEFYQLPYQTKYIDIGNDNLHPGPGQHQFYADAILKIINHG